MHTLDGGDYAFLRRRPDVAVTVHGQRHAWRGGLAPTSLTVGEGGNSTYTVKLDTQPSGEVTVAISSDNTDVTASPSSLTFTTTTWSAEQTVTVTAGQDADAANDTAALRHDPSGGGYDSASNADLTVTVTDDETAGVTVTPLSLTVGEGGTNTYTVVLDTRPTAAVTVTINDPTDNTDVTANPASLTFSTSNWSTAQTVTVSAAEDGDSAQDTATVTHTVSGGDYGSVTADDVSVTVNDTPGLSVTPASLTIDEGGTGTYTVVLDTRPTAAVTVAISSNNADVTTNSSSLTFTTTNWNSAQTVTVTAGDDPDAANDTATLRHNPSGGGYNSVSDVNLTVTVTDDETAGVTVTPTSLTVDEGGMNTYTVVLDTRPTAAVRVTINDPTDNTDVTANPASLTFSTSNWSTAKTVTVSAAEDGDSAQDTATVTHTVSGGDYASITASDVAVTVTDNDTRGVTVTPGSLTVGEGGTGRYTVKLNTQPSDDVTVLILDLTNNADVTASPSSLTFTATNWNSAQTVTVSAAEDADATDDTATLTHIPSGGGYNSVSDADLTVTVTDNDTRGVTVTPLSLTVNEGGTNTYTVVLDTRPTAFVTVTIVDPTDNADVTANPASLTFSPNHWNTAKTVTVSAVEDDDSAPATATVTHTLSGGDYASITASDVAVTVTDNDTPP